MTFASKWLAPIGLVLLFSSVGMASTAEEALQKALSKYAFDQTGDFKPKGTCVCQDGGANDGLAGYLTYFAVAAGTGQAVRVVCDVFAFDGSGNLGGSAACSKFVTLAK
jgi:hypothetical protein